MTESTQVADLARRVDVLEAEAAIVKTLYRLAVTLDYGDHDGWLACIADDIVFEMVEVTETERTVRVRHEGKDALAAFIPGHTHAPAYFHKHLVADPMVEVDGDTAEATAYLTRVDKGEQGPFLWSFGRYLDSFARGTDGRWRLARRTIEVESRAVPVKSSDIGAKH
ncbi:MULTISPECIES: nuclear transport factor 2 family protein [unclassified Nocardioides]|uniref:nuclear transport factor 2 family protein n=1 Tax=unclassified Nocardioides TaxID=2615069 RepID=UPI003606A5D8